MIGFSDDDARLLATGRVFITGRYQEPQLKGLIAACQPRLGFLPSIFPETWCFALTALLDAGLDVAAFDLGAQSARLQAARPHATSRSLLLPPGLPAADINNLLLAHLSDPRYD